MGIHKYCWFEVTCDIRDCGNGTSVEFVDTLAGAEQVLIEEGWGVHNQIYICPEHKKLEDLV